MSFILLNLNIYTKVLPVLAGYIAEDVYMGISLKWSESIRRKGRH